jgi:3-hydroxyisobutyrate dehydrogenase
MHSNKKIIAVIGTGIMGSGIATNFLKKGYKVIVWNRTKEKLKPLLIQGAIAVDTPKAASTKADIIFEVTANDESSQSVWLGEDGILAGAHQGTVAVASGTFSVSWIDKVAGLCRDKKLIFFDMPLTGGRKGAETGKLILLVGGEQNELSKIEEDLKAISEKYLYFGKVGSGIRYKLLLNMLQAIHISAFGEVLKIAERAGLDIKKVGDAIAERPGGVTTNIAWRDYQNEPDPINFSIKWITKDLSYVKELADNIFTPILDETLDKYKKALENNLGEKDWTSINKE